MGELLRFSAPRQAHVVEFEDEMPGAQQYRIETLYSGISAGTELTAYRGTNPYLNRRWVAQERLFVDGGTTVDFPIDGTGYEEVGTITAAGPGADMSMVGQLVWGDWGHRTSCVRDADWVQARVLPDGLDPKLGIFAKIGAIGLNAVLDADIHIGETVVVFGAGVPGQIVAQLARLNGARVIVVDPDESRRDLATRLGAALTIDPMTNDVADVVKGLTDHRGADVVVEMSGSYVALQESIRVVAYSSRVVVSGFYQGEGAALRLGEEFHHNRVNLVGSQISGVSPSIQHRWDELRMSRTVLALARDGQLNLRDLISHTVTSADSPAAFEMIDSSPSGVLQVVIDYRTSTD
ncbi:2-desacetyl-2-hydroxyethyl bacteriochlorophyllide A dehydrogenase [Salinibacterium sp. CAN_S4]|uniref:zinc-dependent alcohol dehydrogenase n=1 Tax=Salinibacterium sp. CAN_S4 TaxID=2787727 RepID=UPI0018F0106A